MSIRQLAVLGRRAVVSRNPRIVERRAVLRNQRFFSGKVLSEEEKAGENIHICIKEKEMEALARMVSQKVSEAVREAVREVVREAGQETARTVNGQAVQRQNMMSNTISGCVALGWVGVGLSAWYHGMLG